MVKIFFLITSNKRRSRTLFDCLLFDVKQVKLLWRDTERGIRKEGRKTERKKERALLLFFHLSF